MGANEVPNLQKHESSDEYKRATAFFRHRARPNECDVNEQSQQVYAAPSSGNEPEEVEHMEVEEPNTNDEENSSEAVEAVGNPTENNGPNSDEICLANDNPLAANTLSTPFDKKPRKKKAPGPFKKKDVKKWKKSYPYIRRILRKVDYVCSYFYILS